MDSTLIQYYKICLTYVISFLVQFAAATLGLGLIGGVALLGTLLQAQQITNLDNGRKDLERQIQSLRESIETREEITNAMTDRSDEINESIKENEDQIQETSNNLAATSRTLTTCQGSNSSLCQFVSLILHMYLVSSVYQFNHYQ